MKYLHFAAVAAFVMASPLAAQVVFDNPFDDDTGNCSFNTTCGPSIGDGNSFAGQLFTLSQATVLTSATFTAVDLGSDPSQPSSVNWLFLAADLNTSLPGTLIASGSSAIASRTLNVDSVNWAGSAVDYGFGLTAVNLAAGSYYFGLQAVSSSFAVYLGSASQFGGAVLSSDGGMSWVSTYKGLGGVAVSLSSGTGAVPEPASWAMLIAGFGLVGATMRRRRAVIAA